jgi:N6-adenosine-specific RNA methylase IME4
MMLPFPNKQYSIIYADPPWAWSKEPLVDRGSARAVEKEYPTMQPEEIMALPVSSIALDRSVLFMWATSPKLPLAFEVMKAWGFDFKTVAFVWVKKNRRSPDNFTGMGFYTRQNAEFVLLGTRGEPSLARDDLGVHQVVETPIYDHSVKPNEIRYRIDRLYNTGDRIELFARRSAPGWDVWGFDAPIASIEFDVFGMPLGT